MIIEFARKEFEVDASELTQAKNCQKLLDFISRNEIFVEKINFKELLKCKQIRNMVKVLYDSEILSELGYNEFMSELFSTYALQRNVSLSSNRNSKVTDALTQYLNKIGEYELLTPEEEAELFKQYCEASGEEKREIFEKIYLANLRLVVSVASKDFAAYNSHLLDLIQEANIELMKCIKKFDVSKGYKLSTFTENQLKRVMDRYACYNGKTMKMSAHIWEALYKIKKFEDEFEAEHFRKPTTKEISEALDISENKVEEYKQRGEPILYLDAPILSDSRTEIYLSDTIEDKSLDEEEPIITKDELNEIFKESGLDIYQKIVLNGLFGLDGQEPRTQEQMGHEIKRSKARVGQIKNESFYKIIKDEERYERLIQMLRIWYPFKELPTREELMKKYRSK